jgi:hypothetical protein
MTEKPPTPTKATDNVLSEAIEDMLEPLMGDICPNSALLMIATGDPTNDKVAISTGVNIPDAWDGTSVVDLLVRLIDRVAEHRGWDVRSISTQIDNMIGDREAAAAIAQYEAAQH